MKFLELSVEYWCLVTLIYRFVKGKGVSRSAVRLSAVLKEYN